MGWGYRKSKHFTDELKELKMPGIDPRFPVEVVIVFRGFGEKTIVEIHHPLGQIRVPLFPYSSTIPRLLFPIQTDEADIEIIEPEPIGLVPQRLKSRFKNSLFSPGQDLVVSLVVALLAQLVEFKLKNLVFDLEMQEVREFYQPVKLLFRKLFQRVQLPHESFKHLYIHLKVLSKPVGVLKLLITIKP
jgi:hypothetical protein